MISDFHLLRPEWLLALLPLALLWWLSRRSGQHDNAWRKVCDEHLLRYLSVDSGGRAGQSASWLLGTGWLLATVALAGPTWERQPMPVFQSQDARVIVLDLSRSMLADDLRPNRINRARFEVEDILERSREGQTALVAFAGDAFTVAPLTDDADTIRNLLVALEPDIMPVQGSRPDLGLERAGELLRQAGVPTGEIVLIGDDAGDQRTTTMARRLSAQGYTISVLAAGTLKGAPVPGIRGGLQKDRDGRVVMAPLDQDGLQRVAAAGGGRYAVIGPGDQDTTAVMGNPSTPSDSKASDLDSEQWLERGPWLVVALLPLAALAFRRGWLLILPLVVIATTLPVTPAQAASWRDLWQRQDQQAAQALQAGDLERARELARDPARRGSAAYRAGDYQAALDAFSASSGVQAAYNRGNAMARLGELEDAIAAYSEALQTDPQMEDALFNKSLVEKLLEQQQQDKQPEDSDPQDQASSGDQQNQDNRSGEGEQQQDTADQKQNPAERADQDSERSQQARAEQPQGAGNANDSDAAQEQAEPGSDESQSADAQASQQPPTAPPEQTAGTEPGEPEQPLPGAVQADADKLSGEEQQAAEQWLQRIPDDPGGLLRRKFLYQYRQRTNAAVDASGQTW